jgi:predicted acylesterase/phospholipase RssA/CRP-like cAMP-binding protein
MATSEAGVRRSREEAAAFLASVPVFAGLSEDLRGEIAQRSTWVQAPAGSVLFNQGDPGDSLYVVRSGRLEVLVESEEFEPAVARVLTRGAAVGELAIITGSPRSATVRARRDSELLRLGHDDFAALLRDHPDFSLALTRELGRQLQESRALTPPERPHAATITLVALGRGDGLGAVCERLMRALGQWGAVARLDGGSVGDDPDRFGSVLDAAERANRQVLLVADSAEDQDSWAHFCLRQADRLIAVVDERLPPAWVAGKRELHGCDVVFHQRPGKTIEIAAWLDALRPRAIHKVRGGGEFDGDVERLARRLAGRSVGLVLSGGGARGFAHVGVIAELLEAGVEIDRVGGCSMGAFVGALLAMELDPAEIKARCHEAMVVGRPLSDYTVPVVALLRGQRARAMLTAAFQETRIEELPRDYFSVSCDLLLGELVVHRRGPLFEAVGISMCLPGVFAPVSRDGRLLVDGGVLNNLPVEPMTSMGEGPVIASDVSARFLPPEAVRRGRPRARAWASRARRAVAGADDPLPSIKETLVRTLGIGGVDALEAARRQADLLITPETGLVPLLDFGQLDRMVEIGREAARSALVNAGDGASWSG